ncbi:RNAi-mediated silencing protein, NRDE2-like protein Nrl1-like [Schizosaccharomyces osmophilus]|uniref:RNAi-mediated silencing protein, NRDE2-like protein Nrl1-like n=1 Tax=Schizosaccharomyces osmophilus TaxID=2545709 RepID=A0AAE9WAU8_9SCHI|nr:RNAi-mediated silencing protein, NRDE2-like protein Nrl1-like [Schizosaccharomyces osmophilus]WBW71877.1 RNAi-mediated silencing protein, NRDE2-like protein Nrl1-like [Schizosaccharomyces osmophilus]
MLPRKDVPVPKFGSFKPIKHEKEKHTKKRERENDDRDFKYTKHKRLISLTDRDQQSYNVKYDTKGDRKVFFYGGIHKYSIPNYMRKSNVVMGSNPEKVILHKMNEGLYLKDAMHIPNSEEISRNLIVASSIGAIPRENEFLPFPESSANVTEDKLSVPLDDNKVKGIQNEIAQVRKELERNSLSPSLWLHLCSLQKDLLLQEYARPNMSVREERSLRRSIHEIQISVLEKAIFSHDFVSSDVEQLVSEYFKLGFFEWDSKTTQEHWENLLSRYGLSENLWILYVNFLMSNVHSFTVDSCLQILSDCLGMIRKKIDKLYEETKSLNENIQKLEKTVLYVLLRICYFARDSGFFELAYAITQVNMEVNYFLPESLKKQDLNSIKRELSKFWESDKPKFGEPGALGWRNSSNAPSFSNKKIDDSQSSISVYDSFLQWTENEKSFQEQKAWREPKLARRLNSKDDPFRHVIFEDVKGFICRFFTPKALLDLKYCLLNFYGLPILPPEASNEHFFVSDPWFSSNLKIDTTVKESESVNDLVSSKILSPGFLEIYFPCSTDLPDYVLLSLKAFSKDEIDRLNTILYLLLQGVDDEYFAGLYLTILQKLCQLEFEDQEYDIYSSVIKDILKKYESSVFVWNCFAETEFMNGKVSLCEKIYKTAYVMQSSKFSDLENVWFHKNWAMQKFFLNDELGFWNVLIHLFQVDQTSTNSADKTGLANQVLVLFEDEQDSKKAVNISLIYLLLSIFIGTEPVHSTIEKCVSKLDSMNGIAKENLEYLYVISLAVAMRNAKERKIFSVTKMRPILEKAVQLFPNNIVLWDIFSWFESKHRFQFRVKNKAWEVVRIYQDKAIYPSYVIIMEEAKLSLEKMKNAIERIFLIRGLDFILGFWKVYLYAAVSNTGSNKMDCILGIRKAISHCPFQKDLYIHIFTLLQTGDYLDEAKIFYLLMIEKGFRLHNEVASTILESTVMKHYLHLPRDSRVVLSHEYTNK